MPGALIPFCAYGGNMRVLGRYINGLNYPVCDKFQSTVLDGQVCYALDIKTVLPSARGKTTPRKGNGIFLAINMAMSSGENKYDPNKVHANNDVFETKRIFSEDTVTINLGTLLRFTDSKAGIYTMTDLKKMTGTQNFLGLPDAEKNCQIEIQEKCNIESYIENVQSHCGCLPWSLSGHLKHEYKVYVKN